MGIKLNQSLGRIVQSISKKENFSVVTVESVIYKFITNLTKTAETSRRVVIPGITSIKVILDLETKEYFVRGRVSPTLKRRLNQLNENGEVATTLSTRMVIDISNKIGIPVSTVDTILRDFIEELLDEAVNEGRINIPCLTTIRVMQDGTGDYITRGRVSPALQSRLKTLDEKV